MASLAEENEKLRQQIQLLTQEKQATLQRVQVKLQQLIAQKNEAQALVTEREAENKRLSEQLSDPSAAGDADTNLDDLSVDELKQRLAALEFDRSTLQQKIKTRLSGLISEKHQKTQRIKELEQRQVNPAELQNLREKIQDLTEERTELTQRIAEANSQLQDVQSWLQENHALREQLDSLMVESRSIQQQITDIQQAHDKAASEIHEYANQIAQLEEMNADYEKKIQELKVANRSASASVDENRALREQVAALSAQKQQMTAQLQQYEASSANQQISNELTLLRTKVAASEGELAEKQAALTEAQAKRAVALESVEILRNQKTTLMAEKKGLQTQMQQMQRKADIDTIENEQYERTLKEITESKNLLTLHIVELETEIEKGQEWDKQNRQLRADMDVLRQENAALEQQLIQVEKGFEEAAPGGPSGGDLTSETVDDDILNSL
eukprot:c52477_g1_i1.p2 GENE.c52477_g1_i1~~c52477_g1_i1.p2  ORF type:complete len:442 (+),score=135.79 c52477_g1_i1:227-1552(+)